MKRKSIVSLLAIAVIAAIVVVVMFVGFAKDTVPEIQIEIKYSGSWYGVYGADDAIEDNKTFAKGTGDKIFTVSVPERVVGPKSVVYGCFQKHWQDDSNEALTVNIIKNGEVFRSKSTTSKTVFLCNQYWLDEEMDDFYQKLYRK